MNILTLNKNNNHIILPVVSNRTDKKIIAENRESLEMIYSYCIFPKYIASSSQAASDNKQFHLHTTAHTRAPHRKFVFDTRTIELAICYLEMKLKKLSMRAKKELEIAQIRN